MVLAYTQDVVMDTPHSPHLIGAASTAQFGISGQCSHHVARHINLGDDSDIAVGSIAHDFAYLVLGEETTVTDAVIHRGIVAKRGAVAPTAHLGQAGILLDFDSPSLVIGQMPVQTVHAMQGHDIKVTLHRLDTEEVTHAIQVHAAVAEARSAFHLGGRQVHSGSRANR